MKTLLVCVIAVLGSLLAFQDSQGTFQRFSRTQDVIYGRKDGLAMTMDVLVPVKKNGAAIVSIISAGFRSTHAAIDVGFYKALLERGYTVFAVVHGSQPKYTIQETVSDVHRAIRFIRCHAKDFHIDPEQVGIMGASAGGHLSLLLATTGCDGDPAGTEPVDRYSSRVQAAACYFPMTDFLNYGAPGTVELGYGLLASFRAAFDFHRFDVLTGTYQLICDESIRQAIGRQVSPAYHVNGETAPCLIIHGDADELVPIQQSQLFVERLKHAGVPFELVTKPGAGHGWPAMNRDVPTLADWFDRHLTGKEPQRPNGNVLVLVIPLALVVLYFAGRIIRRNWKLRHA